MSFKTFLQQVFTWWNGQTLGTRFHTWRKGERVGEDEFGNAYYQDRSRRRRWVIYNGEVEASRVPPGWNGWLHYRVDTPPSKETYVARTWEKPYRPNPTGTPEQYQPQGSLLRPERRPEQPSDYQPWKPE